MSGRAGRPQFDDSGVVVLMTRNETVHLYENVLSGAEPAESELLPSIAEHLNAEIVLLTVTEVGRAIDWLKCSYLYVRMRKGRASLLMIIEDHSCCSHRLQHPKRYNIEKGITKDQMETHMKEICLKAVNELAKYGLALMDEYGFTLKPLESGCLMAKYYLDFETMKTITEIPSRSEMAELLRALRIQLKRHEKKVLNAINQDNSRRIRFPVLGANGKAKKRIQINEETIFVLVNHALSDEPSALDFSMSQDLTGILSNGSRIARCMGEYFKVMQRYAETKNSILLSKCLRQKLWENSAHLLKQLPGIGPVTVKAFQAVGIDSFEKLGSADPRYLESIAGRRFPYGNQVKDSLTALPPKVDLKICHSGFQIGGENEYSVELTRSTQPKTSTVGIWRIW